MSSIPLPALDLKTPQQPDVFEDVSKLMALKSMMGQQQMQQQELQIRQQQVQDQQATTKAMKNWDGQDYDSLAKSVLQNGGSAQAAQAVQQHGLTVKKTVSDIAAQDATTGSKNLETFIGRHKAIGDALEGIENVPDDQLHQKALDTIGQLTKSGILDPQSAQQLAQGVQQAADPKTLRDQIDVFAKSSMGAKAVADQQKTQAETAKDQAQQGEATAAAGAKRQESSWYAAHGGAPGVPTEAVQMSDWLQNNPGKTPSDFVVWKAHNSPSMLLQGGVGAAGTGDPMVDMVGQGRVDLTTALQRMAPVAKESFMKSLSAKYPEYYQAQFGVEKKVQEEFTSGDAAKNLTAFNTAIEHANQLKQAADALDNGDARGLNKIGNTLGYQFGSDKTTNFGVIKSALSGEISKVFKGGQATDAEIKDVQQPFDAANSPAQLKGAIDNAVRLMNSKRDALKQQYQSGAQGKPNFGNSGGLSVQAPNGKTYTFKDQASLDNFKKAAGIQ